MGPCPSPGCFAHSCLGIIQHCQLFLWDLVLGGLVWILIALSQVPLPLFQGWVVFVSMFCFISTTALLFVYITGAHGKKASWETLETVYHSLATLFYLSASILEGLATNIVDYEVDFTNEQYLENIIATVSLPVNLPMFTAPTTH
ncbi:PREDICTED: myelin and lymphocyte protein-like [Ceratotherium simum simum]|uniref:Myelin and lymphocyte protein n=1 Tax=Ceratotherium simum simum TaxID=73337 RepID=A0ABM1C702_CERSS|nr:PREDICTED: myelin and lymphocyte protein-like [Ceratotherium simum simum]